MKFSAYIRPVALSLFALITTFCCTVTEAQTVTRSNGPTVEDKVRMLEENCVSSLRTFNVAQVTYWGGDETKGFARTFKQLGPDGEGLLDETMVSGERYGYRFRLIVPDVGEDTPIQHYAIIAQPVKRLSTRQRSYYTDETHVIRFTELDHEPTSSDPPLEPPKER